MARLSYRDINPSLKLAVTAFLLLAVAGLGIAALQIYSRTGFTARGALLHYRGDETTLQYPKSFNEMVEITHAHAFTMPLLAVALSVGIALSSAAEPLKRLVVMSLFTGVALELTVPWMVRYGPTWTVHLFAVAGMLLGAGLMTAVIVPLREMWWPSPGSRL